MPIYVGNLSYDVSEHELNLVFSEYGSVKQVKLPMDRETGRPRGFAFIEMSTESEEATAIEELDGAEWMEREMKVKKAEPREKRPPSVSGRKREESYSRNPDGFSRKSSSSYSRNPDGFSRNSDSFSRRSDGFSRNS
ncbi:MAG: RNA-binding protein [Cyanothece sp. SIO1E1]|nr:RNA-binding protein [Cyanothece sp. SIO1E1]